MRAGDHVWVMWAGKIHKATVISIFKNGRVNVTIEDGVYTGWTGGRFGHTVPPPRVRIDPWNVFEHDPREVKR